MSASKLVDLLVSVSVLHNERLADIVQSLRLSSLLALSHSTATLTSHKVDSLLVQFFSLSLSASPLVFS